MASTLSRSVASLLALALASGCGDMLRYEDRIDVPLTVPGVRALDSLEDSLSAELLEELNGRIPETWPETLPHVTEDLDIDLTIPIRRGDLGEVGQDLEDAFGGLAEVRMREIGFTFDPGTLTHPVVAGTVYVGPADAKGPGHPGVDVVGRLEGLSAGQGTVLFSPGGRHAMEKQLIEDELTVMVRLVMAFDSRADRRRPEGQGALQLALYVDVLK